MIESFKFCSSVKSIVLFRKIVLVSTFNREETVLAVSGGNAAI